MCGNFYRAVDVERDPPLTIVGMSMADDVVAMIGARARRLATPRSKTSSDWRRVRAERDPFDLWLAPSAGSRQCTESYGAAQELMLVLGDGEIPPVVDSYLRALSAAPVQHLRSLIKRGARIVFAPTIAVALTSPQLQQRRDRPLTLRECHDVHREYAPESLVGAIYDPETDTLVFPTGYCCMDLEHAVLHELGHALTWHQAQRDATKHSAILRDLPFGIRRHLRNYVKHEDKILEVLAEAYTMYVVGRENELPAAVSSELVAMLSS